MTSGHEVARAADEQLEVPGEFKGHSSGFRRWAVLGEGTAAVHTGFGICELDAGGEVDWHVHSYEESFYLLSGTVVCETEEGPFLLEEGDYGVVNVGAPHAWRNVGSEPARWADMLAQQPRSDREDTFFVPPRWSGADPIRVDARDPRTRSFGHISRENSDVDKQTQEHLSVSASMRTALLVYSGITVKMMVDSDLGADLQTMFMVQYEPGGFAGAHDHPLEETYLILEGKVDAVLGGREYHLGPGDIAFAGVGCTHQFSNPGPGRVRWLETQAPQPPGRHSYRFSRDWQYLREVL